MRRDGKPPVPVQVWGDFLRTQRICGRFLAVGRQPYDARMAARAFVSVRPVRNGNGLVARMPIPAGHRICVFRGRVRTSANVLRLWAYDRRRAANCIRCGPDDYLDPDGELGAFGNHSCRPNAAIVLERGRLVLRALRAIRAGAEVTHDYSTCLGADDVWTMRCNCGERGCRGRVRRFDRLPPAVLRRYIRLGAIPSFILETAEAH